MDNFIIGAVFLPVTIGMTIGAVIAMLERAWSKHIDFIAQHQIHRQREINKMHARVSRAFLNK